MDAVHDILPVFGTLLKEKIPITKKLDDSIDAEKPGDARKCRDERGHSQACEAGYVLLNHPDIDWRGIR